MSLGPLDLSALDAPAGTVMLPGGKVVAVRSADGHVYRALHRLGLAAASFAENPAGEPHPDLLNTRILWDLAARCLPDLAPEEIEGLTAVQCGIILRVAQGRISELLAQVEALEKKAPGADGAPAPETSPQSSVPG